MKDSLEAEIRSFITEKEYLILIEFFKKNANLEKEDFQETHYFNCKEDLRIQKSNKESKIWMKKGQIHDEIREEIEIKIQKEDFEKAKEIFNSIGLDTQIKWLRKRLQFNWKGIKVCLDYTKGYGYILELEKKCSEKDKEKVLEELKTKLKELKIPLTPKSEFDEKYEQYKQNWRKLIDEQ